LIINCLEVEIDRKKRKEKRTHCIRNETSIEEQEQQNRSIEYNNSSSSGSSGISGISKKRNRKRY
jgi:hypothetical protein